MSLLRNILSKTTNHWKYSSRLYSTEVPTTSENTLPKTGGFSKAYQKFEQQINEAPIEIETAQTFASLLRNSKFIDLGDPEGKIVTGKIFHVVDDDLYIDFGWKFHCVCSRPRKNSSDYIRGARVRLLVKELELSSLFLGYQKDLTLLEADCALLGLVQDNRNQSTSN